jgi:hypothetical protein
MIEKLTDAQIDRFPEFVKKWTDIGLCTLPADRLRAEHGIRLAYEAAKMKAPVKIVWTSSPFAQGLTRAIVLDVKGNIGRNVGAGVGASVRDSVWASVGASVRDSVWASVWAGVRDSVGASVWDSVGASGLELLGAIVRAR